MPRFRQLRTMHQNFLISRGQLPPREKWYCVPLLASSRYYTVSKGNAVCCLHETKKNAGRTKEWSGKNKLLGLRWMLVVGFQQGSKSFKETKVANCSAHWHCKNRGQWSLDVRVSFNKTVSWISDRVIMMMMIIPDTITLTGASCR